MGVFVVGGLRLNGGNVATKQYADSKSRLVLGPKSSGQPIADGVTQGEYSWDDSGVSIWTGSLWRLLRFTLEEELNETLTRTTTSSTGTPGYTVGALDATVGWATAHVFFEPGTEWIELTLPIVQGTRYKVVGVVTQRGNDRDWMNRSLYVSSFKVRAYIESVWVDVNRDGETASVWAGPNAQSTDDERIEARFPVSQQLVTTKIRVIPWTWVRYPVLRVGLIVAPVDWQAPSQP